MRFEWDEAKARTNEEKHKISFGDASEMFRSPRVLRYQDTRFEYGETREIALGEVEGIVLYVVFTVRDEVIRLISARKANRREAEKYRDYFQK